MDVQAWRDDLAYLIDRIQLYDELPAKPALLELLSEFNSELDLWECNVEHFDPEYHVERSEVDTCDTCADLRIECQDLKEELEMRKKRGKNLKWEKKPSHIIRMADFDYRPKNWR